MRAIGRQDTVCAVMPVSQLKARILNLRIRAFGMESRTYSIQTSAAAVVPPSLFSFFGSFKPRNGG